MQELLLRQSNHRTCKVFLCGVGNAFSWWPVVADFHVLVLNLLHLVNMTVRPSTLFWRLLELSQVRALVGRSACVVRDNRPEQRFVLLREVMMESCGRLLWLDEGGLLLHNSDPPTGGDSSPDFFLSFLSVFMFICSSLPIHWRIRSSILPYSLPLLSVRLQFASVSELAAEVY
jgi:hypothetical protein